jgi:3-dehydroquinate synthase
VRELEIKSSYEEESYKIKIKRFNKNFLEDLIYNNDKNVFIITDENVFKNYKDYIPKKLLKSKIEVLPAGEKTKSIKYLTKLYSKFLETGLNRNSRLIAFGGGVIGDLTGFAAATFMRGIEFIALPTTLLSMIDSSIGAKTGINLKEGKNLIGAFKRPKVVFMNINFLQTLPVKEFSSGIAEIIKSALIKNKNLFTKIEKFAEKIDMEKLTEIFENKKLFSGFTEIIYETILIKKKIIENDEHERGERMLLNFGHSFGHSIEKETGFGIYSHGEAVAYGMLIATKLSEEKNYIEKGTTEKIKKLFLKFNLTNENAFPLDDKNFESTVKKLAKNLTKDKKMYKDKINFVFLKKVGNAFVEKLIIK